ncbi:MAG: DUF5696 domain-containing protein [Planctomycetota bacterium]
MHRVVPAAIALAAHLGPVAFLPGESRAEDGPLRLDGVSLQLAVDRRTGRWSLVDKASGVRWPTEGAAGAGSTRALSGGFTSADASRADRLRLEREGAAVEFRLARGGRSLELRWEVGEAEEIEALGDALRVSDAEGGCAIVPCREGLLVPAEGGKTFRRTFGTSEYEGVHMNALAFVKAGSGLLVTWDDAYVFPTLESSAAPGSSGSRTLTARFSLRRSARSLVLTPVGKADWNRVAAAYRELREESGLACTLREKIARNPDLERLIGASNVKLWTCLARRMNEESTKEESVTVHWTFDEAAAIAEHIRRDLDIDRCLFMMGGWTEGGYDCRHPDDLPANPECGGNEALARAIERIQSLGYIACLHDNYQDMYRDARSWDPSYIEKRPDGGLVAGGRWLGGRAYMVCAPKQLELARRPQNLPGIRRLFPARSYFIDTTYAVGPRECHDPDHPIGRNEDILWKRRLSDYAREIFGLFGSECGREWALRHSDFFEGLVGVSGKYYHSLDPDELGATVIPFWEMVYHDCQICWGKYGYAAGSAAQYVAHHVLCARPLHHHSIPDHLYWKADADRGGLDVRPRVVSVEPAGERRFRIRYSWDVREAPDRDWRVFVHFGRREEILFQDDHAPDPPTSRWRKGARVEIGPREAAVPEGLAAETVGIFIGLFDPKDPGRRAPLRGADSERRVPAGRLRLKPSVGLEATPEPPAPEACYLRADDGWAAGLHPTDIFLKNTHEILGPLHAETAHRLLARLEFLSEDRSLRRATYGSGDEAVEVVVNFASRDAEATTRLGGSVLLPPFGFVVEGPRLVAFYAKRWGGEIYPSGSLFTVRSLDGAKLGEAKRVRVFHGFGSRVLPWKGRRLEVERETVIAP